LMNSVGDFLRSIPIVGDFIDSFVVLLANYLFPALVGALTEMLAVISKVASKAVEPAVKAIFKATKALEKFFGVEDDWIQEMRNSGLELASDMGKEMVDQMAETWSDLKNILADSLSAAFKSFNVSSGWHNFEKTFREGMYNMTVDSISKALAKALSLHAIAPYINDFIKLLIRAAITGEVDVDELDRITSGIASGTTEVLEDNEEAIKAWTQVMQDFQDKMLRGGTSDSSVGRMSSTSSRSSDDADFWGAINPLANFYDKFGSGGDGETDGATPAETFGQAIKDWLADRPLFGSIFGTSTTTWLADRPKFGEKFVDGLTTWLADRPKFGELFRNKFFDWLADRPDFKEIFWWKWHEWLADRPEFGELFAGKVQSWFVSIPSPDFNGAVRGAIRDWLNDKKAAKTAIQGHAGIGGEMSGSFYAAPRYATGTDYVPSTGLALLHKGEAVVPEVDNNAGREITVNINNPQISNGLDVRAIAQELGFLLEAEMRAI
jgi:hypothetical protein